jgi:hypothetical protein
MSSFPSAPTSIRRQSLAFLQSVTFNIIPLVDNLFSNKEDQIYPLVWRT